MMEKFKAQINSMHCWVSLIKYSYYETWKQQLLKRFQSLRLVRFQSLNSMVISTQITWLKSCNIICYLLTRYTQHSIKRHIKKQMSETGDIKSRKKQVAKKGRSWTFQTQNSNNYTVVEWCQSIWSPKQIDRAYLMHC